MLEAEKGNLTVIKLGGWNYLPAGSLDRLVAERLKGKR
jgi:hypothetical protein